MDFFYKIAGTDSRSATLLKKNIHQYISLNIPEFSVILEEDLIWTKCLVKLWAVHYTARSFFDEGAPSLFFLKMSLLRQLGFWTYFENNRGEFCL